MKGDTRTTSKPRGLYVPGRTEPYKLSRSKIELFVRCPRCFYFDRRHGVSRPPGFPFLINTAIDTLFKREFDRHRVDATPHAIMTANKIDAVPFQHLKLEIWRGNFSGIQHNHKATNFNVFGAIDDVWVKPNGELIMVDYKATAKEGGLTLISRQRDEYKRQLGVYIWLFRQNGFKVSDTAYLVYANGKTDRHAFEGRVEFDVELLSYRCPTDWIEPTLTRIKQTLEGDAAPTAAEDCDYCSYHTQLSKAEAASDSARAHQQHQTGLFEHL